MENTLKPYYIFFIFNFHISFVVCNSQATDTVVLSLVTDVPSQYDWKSSNFS